jgi:hypothetical protein
MQIRSTPFLILLSAISLTLTTHATGSPQQSAPPAGKATIIVYRLSGMLGAAAHFSMFANGDFAGEMRRSTYTTYEADKGHVVITAMILRSGWGTVPRPMGFPPPVDWWPSGSACGLLDWRHLAGAKAEDVWRCKQYIRDWTSSNVTAVNGIRYGKMNPALAVLEAEATTDIPVGQQPISVEGGNNYCPECLAGRFELEVEDGKVYYVESYLTLAGAKWRPVDVETGAKKVRGLKVAENR